MTLHPNMGLTAAAGLRSRDSHYGWVAKVAEQQPEWLASLPARLSRHELTVPYTQGSRADSL